MASGTTLSMARGRIARARQQCRRGVASLYVIIILLTLVGFVTLGLDLGRVQLTKTELQRAVDAAARYAVLQMPNGISAVQAAAVDGANDNMANGQPVVVDATNDIQFGTWNATTRTFTVLTGSARSSANAIRVYGRRTAARGTAVPLTFGPVIGRRTCDVNVSSIAMFSAGIDSVIDVPATSNIFLAGNTTGTIANPVNPHNNPDHAKLKAKHTSNHGVGDGRGQADSDDEPDPNGQSPVPAYNINVTDGLVLSFDSINGGATNDITDSSRYTGDGNTDWITDNIAGAENGKSDVFAPINAVMGVFLTDASPTSMGTPPATLDFSTAASRDFNTLSPQLRQVFFIGDGRNSAGAAQQFVAPPGATRLYIGTMDSYEWNNNAGSYTTTIHKVGTATLVK